MRACEQCGVEYPDAVRFCPRDGARLGPEPEEAADPLIGTTIDGRYIVESQLGKGGMGFVYAARHAIIDKAVAIKVLRADTGQDNSAAERFIVEAKAASKIGHPNIVDITDFGVLKDGQPYFVMEFLNGPTLGKLISTEGVLEPRRVVAITAQIARGLLAAHQKGIVHRDLKPDNIFVIESTEGEGEDETVKIVDFGIARDVTHQKRLTVAGMVLGTPEYMSPEQATGQPADHRVDIYALGCIVYEMLTGDVPFRADTATKTLTKHVFDPVIPPSQKREGVPASLEAAVMRMLAKKSTDRYPSLKELLNDLDGVDGELRPRHPRSRPEPSAHSSPTELVAADVPLPRNRAPLYAIGGFLAIAAVVAIGLLVRSASTRNAEPMHSTTTTTTNNNTPPPPPNNNTTTTTPTPAVNDTPPNPAAASEITITFRSQPPGAEIFVGDELLGTSPATFKYKAQKTPVMFVLKRAGFRDSNRELIPDRDVALDVSLVAKPAGPPNKKQIRDPKGGKTPKGVKGVNPGKAVGKRPSDLRNPFD